MSFNSDPYNTGIPKYQTANSMSEGLCAVAQGEEIGILSEIFADVSYEGQDYYYTDKGGELNRANPIRHKETVMPIGGTFSKQQTGVTS